MDREYLVTEQSPVWRIKSHYSTIEVPTLYYPDLWDQICQKFDINDVFYTFNFTMIEADISSSELTFLSSQLSEASFAELWEREDDDYWDSYL
jgi:hypothetical protein